MTKITYTVPKRYPLFLQFKLSKVALAGMGDSKLRLTKAFYIVALNRCYILGGHTYLGAMYTTSLARARYWNSLLTVRERSITKVINRKRTIVT
jgi:hypothetical protein